MTHLGRLLSTFCIIFAIWVSKFSHAEHTSSQNHNQEDPDLSLLRLTDELSSAELVQLLQMLDDSPSTSKEMGEMGSHPLLHLGDLLLDDMDHTPTSTTTELFTTTTTTTEPTTTTRKTTTTTPTTTTPTTTTPTTTTTRTTTTTTRPPPPPTTTVPPPPPQISRREDINQPQNHEDLVQQLSLFNSLLMSLATENSTTTEKPDDPNALNEKQMALLAALFGQAPATEPSKFHKRTETPPAQSTTTEVPQTPSPSSPEILALTELLKQIAKANPSESKGNFNLQTLTTDVGNDHLKNFHTTNAPLDAAATSQLTNILTLLGTLGALSQPQQQTSLFNFGAPTVSPVQSNFLTGFLQPQTQSSVQNPNIFGNLFNQQGAYQVQQQPQQPLIGGLSSMFNTVSTILGGSGPGGKPRVRGKGVDTRLGLGYRFGDAADAQIMWDIGPQLFTDKIQNEHRYPMKQKRQDAHHAHAHLPPQPIHTEAQQEKEQQLLATRRFFHVHPSPQTSTRRTLHINPPQTRQSTNGLGTLASHAQEEALKELWQLMALQKQLDTLSPKPPHPVSNGLDISDLYQIGRHKHIMKRASTPPVQIHQETTNPSVPKQDKRVEPQPAESIMFFRKMPMPFAKKSSSGPQTQLHPRSPPSPAPPSPPGLLNLNLFGLFRGPPKPKATQRPSPHRQEGAPSQMSRWDMENHRFDNFKNTNGELWMTDSNKNDRFHTRNRKAYVGRLFEGA